jgi:cyclic pyranopterin phosphate synthase
MVDVSSKKVTHREATAIGSLWLPKCVRDKMVTDAGGGKNRHHHEFCTKKGPVFVTATIAATQAAKLTPQLIPFCHPLPITKCKIDWSFVDESTSTSSGGLLVNVTSVVGAEWVTGVEMEALTAANVALLTCYDMLKGIDGAVTGGMSIREVRLLAKSGGKLGEWKSDVKR